MHSTYGNKKPNARVFWHFGTQERVGISHDLRIITTFMVNMRNALIMH